MRDKKLDARHKTSIFGIEKLEELVRRGGLKS
jgi:hypothetical protein